MELCITDLCHELAQVSFPAFLKNDNLKILNWFLYLVYPNYIYIKYQSKSIKIHKTFEKYVDGKYPSLPYKSFPVIRYPQGIQYYLCHLPRHYFTTSLPLHLWTFDSIISLPNFHPLSSLLYFLAYLYSTETMCPFPLGILPKLILSGWMPVLHASSTTASIALPREVVFVYLCLP